jgi:membrane-associated phospholipid phosphatase
MRRTLALLLLLVAAPCAAQVPVEPWADGLSWGTALVNPTWAVIDAARSGDVKCRLGRLAVSEAIGMGTGVVLKRLIVSPRPCLGCVPDGMPSNHTLLSTIGFSSHWQVGLYFTLGTAELRTVAHRHTPTQVAAGALLGLAAEWAGTRLVPCRSDGGD